MSPEELAEIEQRAKDATEGPWFVESDGIYDAARSYLVLSVGSSAQVITDSAFIACARSDVPALVAAVRESAGIAGKLAAALAELASASTCWRQCCDLAIGEDRAQCSSNLFQAVESARAVLSLYQSNEAK